MDSAQGMSSLLHFLRLILRVLDIEHKANAGNFSPPRKCNPLICLANFLILQSYLPPIQYIVSKGQCKVSRLQPGYGLE